jgi:hypothetical protein
MPNINLTQLGHEGLEMLPDFGLHSNLRGIILNSMMGA